MTRSRKTASVPRHEAKLYLTKARQFLEEARFASSHERHDAALLNAIHAAISAADAVTVALAGRRSADPDHLRVIVLLRETAGRSAEIGAQVRQLGALLGKKNQVEYESRSASSREDRDAVERAERFVDWAAALVAAAKL